MTEKLLWTVSSWSNNAAEPRDGYEFGIIVSPEFVRLAETARINQPDSRARMNELAIETVVHKAGFTTLPTTWPLFGYHERFGVNKINHPSGDGRWLSINFDSFSLQGEFKGYSHNIDTPSQQSFLIAVWTFYVGYLEMD